MLDAVRPYDVLDRLGEGVIALDAGGRLVYANREGQRLLATLLHFPSDLTGAAILGPGAASSPLGLALQRARDDGAPRVTEIAAPEGGGRVEVRAYPDGAGLSVLLRSLPNPAGGRPGGESPRSSDPASRLLDGVGDAVLGCDHDWRITYLNAPAERYLARLGLGRQRLLGAEIWTIPGLAGTAFQAGAFRAAAEQVEVEVEELFAPLSRWLAVRVGPVPDGVVVDVRDVTERKAAELALREAHRLLRTVVEGATDCIFVKDRRGRYLMVNAAAAAVMGQERGQVIGLTAHDVFPAEIARALQAHDQEVLATGRPQVYEETVLVNGGTRCFLSTKGVYRSASGEVAGVIGVARDITDRKQAQETLQRSERRFRTLLESIDDVVFRLDREQRCKDIFGRWLEREGLSAEALLGRTTAEIVGPGAAAVHEAANRRALAGEPVTYDWTYNSRRGPRQMQTSLSPIRDPTGDVVGIVGVGRDVTCRVAAERELERWARIFEHAGWGVAILSADGHRFETVNPAFARMHGWTTGALAGRAVADLLPPGRHEEFAQRNALLGVRGHASWESEHRRRDGSLFPVLIDATAVRDAAGRVLYQAFNVQDTTERKRAEEQLRQAQKMEAVGRLAGGVAHDFNNMMMIIIGFSDFLMGALDPHDPRRADAEEIRKAAERAMQLTRQLLSFGRRQLVARQVVDLNEVIRGLERMLRPLLGENIGLATSLADELGGVEADHGQLEQVVMNLTLNARDAMQRGGRLLIETMNVDLFEGYGYQRVGIEIPAGSYIMLRVSDTGHGMTPEVKARLFEPFFTTKSTAQNTGLGLATVYGIVAQSGGYIWVDSEPGRGSAFTICLPRAGTEEEGVHAPASAAAPPGGGSETILLVEDEPAVRALAQRVLASQGYTVLEAANGREALELVESSSPQIDLLLTDVVMPELGGEELALTLVRSRPGLRVVYMSGYTRAEKLLPLDGESPFPLLRKPFSPESLALKIREALDTEASRGGASPR